MNFKIVNRRQLIRYVTVACVAVLSLIIADTLLGQSPQEISQPPNTNSLDTDRINSINERISLLKRLADEERRKAAENASEFANEAPKTPAMESNLPVPETQQQSEIFDSQMQNEPPPETFVPTLPPPDPMAKQAAAATKVVNQPLDSFELGNSLFMTGNYSAANKSYNTILDGATASDEVWLRCMIGCNFRLLGELQKAEDAFRKASNSRERESYAVDYARWSLAYIEAKRKSQEEFSLIEQSIDSALEKIKNDSQGQ